MKKNKTCLLFLCFLLLWLVPASALERTALVIGNGNYSSSPLDNSINDATDMGLALKKLGFTVILKLNADKKTMITAMRDFGRNLKGSKIGLFYYAGHGMQIEGINYLVPVNNQIREATEVEFESIDVGRVLAKMESAGNPMNILILDACRDNPFKSSFRTSAKGLAKMDAPPGTIIAYATSPGSVSADGRGRNGIYTESLLRHIQTPELHVRDMFNRTGLDVMKQTHSKQVPWISTSPFPDFYLAGRSITVVSPFKTEPDNTVDSDNLTILKIESDPSGAAVYINETYKGKSPLELSGISPGNYRIKAELSGFRSEMKIVTVNPGGKSILSLFLEPEKKKPRLFVKTTPQDCRVRILNIIPVYFDGIPLDPGRYKIEVSKPGFKTRIEWIKITNDSDRSDIHIVLDQKQTAYPSQTLKTPGKNKYWKDRVTGMEFVWVAPGCFKMGSLIGRKDERPTYRECLKGFWISRYEVTRSQFRQFVNETGYKTDAQKKGAAFIWTGSQWERKKGAGWNRLNFSQADNHPVTAVSWNDARAFANWLSRKTSKRFRLPKEAEWEYAARSGGKAHLFSGGSSLEHLAWYSSNSQKQTHIIGTKSANDLSIYDMSGNVWEWCEDDYDPDSYAIRSKSLKARPMKNPEKVLRGGSWNDIPRFVRTTVRNADKPWASFSDYGFRLVALPR